MRTAVKSIRVTHPIVDQIAIEAERLNTSFSDIVRIAIEEYFKRRQLESSLIGVEQRIIKNIENSSMTIRNEIKKILDLAEPN